MAITATFSNGFTDTYKGQRDVKAAWAIINKETNETIFSGHSLDVDKAAKTAAGRLMAVSFCFHLGMKGDHPLYYVKGPIWSDSLKVKREKREHNAARRAFVESMVKIEIVEL